MAVEVAAAQDLSTDPWDRGGTYTRQEMEHFRGPLNGAVPADSSSLNGSQHEAEPAGHCQQCGVGLDRAGRKWCSQACRAKSKRKATAVALQEARKPVGVDDGLSERPAKTSSLLAQLLDAGAELSFILDGVRVVATTTGGNRD